jgi:hypothetical protein
MAESEGLKTSQPLCRLIDDGGVEEWTFGWNEGTMNEQEASRVVVHA